MSGATVSLVWLITNQWDLWSLKAGLRLRDMPGEELEPVEVVTICDHLGFRGLHSSLIRPEKAAAWAASDWASF